GAQRSAPTWRTADRFRTRRSPERAIQHHAFDGDTLLQTSNRAPRGKHGRERMVARATAAAMAAAIVVTRDIRCRVERHVADLRGAAADLPPPDRAGPVRSAA